MILKIISIIYILTLLTGCSYTLHERKKDPEKPEDVGSKTEFRIRGPKAEIRHSF